MAYLLDTDTFSEYLREEQRTSAGAPITTRVAHAEPGSVFISVVTVSEMMRGILNLLQRLEKTGRDVAGFDELLRVYSSWRRFPIQPYDAAAHARFTAFPAAVRRIGRADCQIAAIALAIGHTVVTRNTRHFAQVPGLLCEDWTQTSTG